MDQPLNDPQESVKLIICSNPMAIAILTGDVMQSHDTMTVEKGLSTARPRAASSVWTD